MSAGEGPVVEEVAFDVLAGNPTEQELAVVVSVLSSLPAVQPEQPNPPSYWSNRAAMMRRTIHPGPGAWRASAFPHPS
ncbi:MAG: acyl-CoA carboxylase subunit epsilon [Candidatus Nanopelagicales bacterium]